VGNRLGAISRIVARINTILGLRKVPDLPSAQGQQIAITAADHNHLSVTRQGGIYNLPNSLDEFPAENILSQTFSLRVLLQCCLSPLFQCMLESIDSPSLGLGRQIQSLAIQAVKMVDLVLRPKIGLYPTPSCLPHPLSQLCILR